MRLVYLFVVEATNTELLFEFPKQLHDVFKMTTKLLDRKQVNESMRVEQESRLVYESTKLLIKKIGDTVLLCAIVENSDLKDSHFYHFFAKISIRLRSERRLAHNKPFTEYIQHEYNDFNARYDKSVPASDPSHPARYHVEPRIELALQGINRGLLEGKPLEIIDSGDLIEIENAHIKQNRKQFRKDLTKHIIFGSIVIIGFFVLLFWHRSVKGLQAA